MSAELLEQHTPRLHPQETELLRALGQAPQDDNAHEIVATALPRK
jgi:hypothetical protein